MKKAIILSLSLMGLIMSHPLAAAELLIKNARLYSQTDSGELINTNILIRGGKLAKIGKELTAGGKARSIDAAGRIVTPGLFGGLSSIGLEEISAEDSTVDRDLNLTQMRPEFNVNYAYNPASSLVAINWIEGIFYAVLSPSESGSIFEGQGSPITLDGISLPQGPKVQFISMGSRGMGDSGGSRAAQYMLLDQAFTEVTASGDKNGPFRLLTHAGRQSLKSRDNPYVFYVNRAIDIRRVIVFIRDHHLHGIIAGASEGWMVASELAAAKIPVIINPLENLPGSFDSLGARLDNAALLDAAGVDVMFSAGGAHNLRKIRQSAGNAVANGMPYTAALAAVTSLPARVFGYQGGKLVSGAVANLVIWDGDPLEVTSSADIVILNGQQKPMVSRQTLLRDRYLKDAGKLPRAYIHP